jgi:hypothetical protein
MQEQTKAILILMILTLMHVYYIDKMVHSKSGVRQGDLLRPLLFALTHQGPLEVAAESNLSRPLTNAGDTFLQGAPEPTIRAYQTLTALSSPLSLHA